MSHLDPPRISEVKFAVGATNFDALDALVRGHNHLPIPLAVGFAGVNLLRDWLCVTVVLAIADYLGQNITEENVHFITIALFVI
jgi:hypothetical protein